MRNEPALEQLMTACELGLIDYAACDALAERHTREIFGRRQSLPADESAIAWNSRLSHEEKVEQLTALRKAKEAKRDARRAAKLAFMKRPFEQRIGPLDAIQAEGMGIRLD